MSLFGSLTTPISGLAAQSRALGHVSDNFANSQTVGFKRVDTSFVNYLTQSSADSHQPGSVIARPDYTNGIQGIVEQAEGPLSLPIGGQGFFSVASPRGEANGQTVLDDRQFFTRAGDFRLDSDGYMVNGLGYVLQGWPSDAAGTPDRTALSPIRIDQQVFNPVATGRIELKANLPADPAAGPISTQAQVYDTLGARHTVNLTFAAAGANLWNLAVDVPDDVAVPARSTVQLQFGAAGAPPAADGTIASFAAATGSVAAPVAVPGAPAEFTFTADFGQGPQTVALNLGAFGQAQGMTQYAGKEFEVRDLAQDGVPLGAYAGLSMRENGDVAVNYDNGQSRIVARVPLVAFSDPDRLQRLDGQAFMRTVESGEARVTDAASNGVGKLVTGSVERSNVDIATEFTKLIVAQRAYTANTRIVTASDEMLQDTINMRR
jgi:flagellar hook protein FlgE